MLTRTSRHAHGQAARVAERLEDPLAIGRAGAGLVMVTLPGVVASVWLGTRSPAGRRFVRMIGIRDLVLCVGELRARPNDRARWRQFAAAADLFDAVVAVGWAVARRRPFSAAVAIPALGSAALGILATQSAPAE